MSSSLSLADASRYARIALANIEREFPAARHVIAGSVDLACRMHCIPRFRCLIGSCVHAHWLPARDETPSKLPEHDQHQLLMCVRCGEHRPPSEPMD
jgi:hypothetical protein